MLSSGAAGGLIWASSMQFITAIIVIIMLPHSTSNKSDFIQFAIGLSCYSLLYALLAAFIRRTFLSTQMDVKNTWVIVLMAVACLTIGPIIFGSILGFNEASLLFATPFAISNNSTRASGLIFAIFGSISLIILSLPWFASQFLSYNQAAKIRFKGHK